VDHSTNIPFSNEGTILRRDFKVQLLMNGSLGKTASIGYRCEKVAQMCEEEGVLLNVLCSSRAHTGLARKKTKIVFPGLSILMLSINYLVKTLGLKRVFGFKIKPYALKIRAFDALSRRLVRDANIFHTWDRCETSIKKAKENGAITVLDVAMDIWDGPVMRYVDYVFVPSKQLFEKALLIGVPKDRVFYQPFGVDIRHFFPEDNKARKVRFMFAGILNERKGLGDLLEAWKQANVEEAELVLCGRETPYSRRMIREYNFSNVTVNGFLKWNELSTTYRNSHVFVFPSRKEGSAKAVYEAMASGLPTITTEESGSVIEHNRDGFIVEIGNVCDLVFYINLLADDADMRKAMGDAAREKVLTYTWDDYKKRTLVLYSQIWSRANKA
jgi:glycosyltransferase involved in cell wall biosynthesis